MTVVAIAVALLPVSVLLLVLVLLDSFKLVPLRALARALLAGGVAAVLAAGLHGLLLQGSWLDTRSFTRFVSPVTEETLKAGLLILLVKRNRMGFLVDAGILGFAAGTGFALVENLDFLRLLPAQSLLLWTVRGFGTAILHGTTTAIVAVTAKSLWDRHHGHRAVTLIPGWLAAIVLHSAFNHALVSPVLAAAMLLTVLPMAVLVVFARSERATREWIGSGLDLDVELLRTLLSADFGSTRVGSYLRELGTRFPGPVVADMLCLLRLQLELAIRAKGMLMAREAGLEVPVDDVRSRLDEVSYLQRSIGVTGLLALRPLQVVSERDHWLRYLLEEARGARRRRPERVEG